MYLLIYALIWDEVCEWQRPSPDSVWRCHLTSIRNPIVEIRRSYDRLISTMGFLILVRHLYIESGPWGQNSSKLVEFNLQRNAASPSCHSQMRDNGSLQQPLFSHPSPPHSPLFPLGHPTARRHADQRLSITLSGQSRVLADRWSAPAAYCTNIPSN